MREPNKVENNHWVEPLQDGKIKNIDIKKLLTLLNTIYEAKYGFVAAAMGLEKGITPFINTVNSWAANPPSYKEFLTFWREFQNWRNVKNKNEANKENRDIQNAYSAFIAVLPQIVRTWPLELFNDITKNVLNNPAAEEKEDRDLQHARPTPNLANENLQLAALLGGQASDAQTAFRDLAVANQQKAELQWAAQQIPRWFMSKTLLPEQVIAYQDSMTALEQKERGAINRLFTALQQLPANADQEVLMAFKKSLLTLTVGLENDLQALTTHLDEALATSKKQVLPTATQLPAAAPLPRSAVPPPQRPAPLTVGSAVPRPPRKATPPTENAAAEVVAAPMAPGVPMAPAAPPAPAAPQAAEAKAKAQLPENAHLRFFGGRPIVINYTGQKEKLAGAGDSSEPGFRARKNASPAFLANLQAVSNGLGGGIKKPGDRPPVNAPANEDAAQAPRKSL